MKYLFLAFCYPLHLFAKLRVGDVIIRINLRFLVRESLQGIHPKSPSK